jgi:hypothetical protein
MMTSRGCLIACAMATLSLIAFCPASAQVYPRYPITIVVPFATGGPADVVARILGDRMSAMLGQPIIVENVPGAGGTIGTGRVARAAPDGHVLALGNLGTHVVNGAIYALPYDVAKDFEPIALLANTPQLILSRNGPQAMARTMGPRGRECWGRRDYAERGGWAQAASLWPRREKVIHTLVFLRHDAVWWASLP